MNENSRFWNHGTEEEWKRALKHYYEMMEARSHEEAALDRFMENLRAEEVKTMPVEAFYTFLYDKYFVWKFTQKNYLANCRKNLRRYVEEGDLLTLANIQKRLFDTNHALIQSCFKTAEEIHGLGTAGASGLLAILFPEDFGTVDQFVVKTLSEIEGISHEAELAKLNPNSLTTKGGVVLTKIFREKAKELNTNFGTDFWTPRKIDMVLWAYGR